MVTFSTWRGEFELHLCDIGRYDLTDVASALRGVGLAVEWAGPSDIAWIVLGTEIRVGADLFTKVMSVLAEVDGDDTISIVEIEPS